MKHKIKKLYITAFEQLEHPVGQFGVYWNEKCLKIEAALKDCILDKYMAFSWILKIVEYDFQQIKI